MGLLSSVGLAQIAFEVLHHGFIFGVALRGGSSAFSKRKKTRPLSITVMTAKKETMIHTNRFSSYRKYGDPDKKIW